MGFKYFKTLTNYLVSNVWDAILKNSLKVTKSSKF